MLESERKQKILDHIDFEIRKYGGTLSEYAARKYIDLCRVPIKFIEKEYEFPLTIYNSGLKQSGSYVEKYKYIDLEYGQTIKNAGYLSINDIQLGDVILHNSKMAYLKSMYPHIKIHVFTKDFHFNLEYLYGKLKCVDKVHRISKIDEIDILIKNNNIDLLIYNRGEIFHSELKYGITEFRIDSSNVKDGFEIWDNHFKMDLTKGSVSIGYINGKPNLVAHIRYSGNCPERNLPLDKWYKIISELENHFNIIMVGHPQIDRLAYDMFEKYGEFKSAIIFPTDNIPLLFDILSNASYFISSDSGPLHIASAFPYMHCIDLINKNTYWGFLPSKAICYSVMADSMEEIDPRIPIDIFMNHINFVSYKNSKYLIRSKYLDK